MKKVLLMLPILAASLSSCNINLANEIQASMWANREAVERNTRSVYQNIHEIEGANLAINENSRKLEEVNKAMSKEEEPPAKETPKDESKQHKL